MPHVRYSGGALDDVELEVDEAFATHPQREVHGPDGGYELYRRTGRAGDVHLFEYAGSSPERVLDDDQNYPAASDEEASA